MTKSWPGVLVFLLLAAPGGGAAPLLAPAAKPVFAASFDHAADAETGQKGGLSGGAAIVDMPVLRGAGALDLRGAGKPFPRASYAGIPVNWRQGSAEAWFFTVWEAAKGTRAAALFTFGSKRKDAAGALNFSLTCDGRYLLCSMTGALRRYFRIEGNWVRSIWHHVLVTWEVVEGEKNDEILIFIDGKLAGAHRDLELEAGKCEAPHPARLCIGQSLAGNMPYGLRGAVDEFRLYDQVVCRAPTDAAAWAPVFEPPGLGQAQRKAAGPTYRPGDHVNIAPFAEIASVPYSGTLAYLVDGVVLQGRGGATSADGPQLEYVEKESKGEINKLACFPLKCGQASITFAFPRAQQVAAVRFLPAGGAPSFRLDADTDGDGKYDAKLLERYAGGGEKGAWRFHAFEPLRLHCLKFTSIPDEAARAPTLSEFQILSPIDACDPELEADFRKRWQPLPGVPRLEFGSSAPVAIPATPAEKRLLLGAYTCFWMFNNHAKPVLGQYNEHAVRSLKDMHMDYVRLSAYLKPRTMEKITLPDKYYLARIAPPVGQGCLLWPSKVCVGYEDNVLRDLVEFMHSQGLKVKVQPPRNIAPFDPRSGYYPMAQSDHHDKRPDPRFPCVTNGEYFEKAFCRILSEIIDSGADGVDVCGDEFYIENHNVTRMSRADPCRKLFKEKYGLEAPKQVEDTERYRKWALFEYESGGALFGRIAAAAKRAKPSVVTATLLSVAGELFYRRTSFGLAYDAVGHAAEIDLLGTDPYYRHDTLGHYQIPKFVQLLAGATPHRRTIMTMQAVCNDFTTTFSNPVWVVGGATSALMNGCKAMDFYRLNYFASIRPQRDHPGTKPIADWCALVRRLEADGLKEATVPSQIAFLYSRASDDWWELKESVGRKPYPNSAMAGYLNHAACMRMLCSNGHPFRLYYLDQPTTLARVAEAKVLVVPFAYSIGDRACEILDAALRNGARLLIVCRLGETDEFGTAREQPALQRFLGRAGVKFLDVDMSVCGAERSVREAFQAALVELLGEDRPLTFNAYGRDVEAGMLERADGGGKFVFLVNWDGRDALVDLGLPLPEGRFRVARYARDERAEGKLGGETAIDSAALRSFRVEVKAHETVVLTVMR